LNEKGNLMRGFIRLFIGILMVFGAVGGMDNGPADAIHLQALLAVAGLLVMYSGVRAMEKL
jgi:hypothetical protein